MPRDGFPRPVKGALAKRVGNRCSNPKCKALTSGPYTDDAKSVRHERADGYLPVRNRRHQSTFSRHLRVRRCVGCILAHLAANWLP